jgi:hypothetical protein
MFQNDSELHSNSIGQGRDRRAKGSITSAPNGRVGWQVYENAYRPRLIRAGSGRYTCFENRCEISRTEPMQRLRLLSLVVLGSALCGQPTQPSSYVPKAGFVPDAGTAVSIAEAVLTPVYGKAQIESERPFRAQLKGAVSIVTGTVPCEGPAGAPCPGGAAEVKISKRSGAILFMTHLQ